MATKEQDAAMKAAALERIGVSEGYTYVPIEELESMIINTAYHTFVYHETICCIRVQTPNLQKYSVIGRYVPVQAYQFEEVHRKACARSDAIEQLIVLEQYRRMML